MMFKKSRLRLANWLSGGRILFDKEENKAMTAIAGQYTSAGIALGNSSGLYILGSQEPTTFISTVILTYASHMLTVAISSASSLAQYLPSCI